MLYSGGEYAGWADNTVNVWYPAIDQFYPTWTLVIPDQTFDLFWDVSFADSVTIDPIGFTGLTEQGLVSTSVTESTTYKLTLHYLDYQTSASTNVELEEPRIRGFRCNPTTILIGESTSLDWNVSYADSW